MARTKRHSRRNGKERKGTTLSKVNALTDAEYKELSVYPADEV